MKHKKLWAALLALLLVSAQLTPALATDATDPAGESSSTQASPEPSTPEPPAEPEPPVDPEQPTEPESPVDPEQPTEPEIPVDPEQPTEPEIPVDPEQPVEPETPVGPVQPVDPENPTEPIPPLELEPPLELLPPLALVPPEPEAIIRVTVPDTGYIQVNPYQMVIQTENGQSTQDQVVHSAQYLTSESNVPLSVSVSITGQIGENSNMRFTSAPPSRDETEKLLHLYVKIQPTVYGPDGPSEPIWTDGFDGALTVDEGQCDYADIARLDTAIFQPDGQTVNPEDASYAAFRLFGSATGSPDKVWTRDDVLDVNLAFTFAPID